ncbi:hypothetical protein CN281_11215 [Bacillus cereus]|nr:hypothetical protein CN281_11215 [Bacillus cereus]PFH95747.1 hypothetical protein COI78_08535 [Bacillus cereus]
MIRYPKGKESITG